MTVQFGHLHSHASSFAFLHLCAAEHTLWALRIKNDKKNFFCDESHAFRLSE
jgi:hypothetical protein